MRELAVDTTFMEAAERIGFGGTLAAPMFVELPSVPEPSDWEIANAVWDDLTIFQRTQLLISFRQMLTGHGKSCLPGGLALFLVARRSSIECWECAKPVGMTAEQGHAALIRCIVEWQRG